MHKCITYLEFATGDIILTLDNRLELFFVANLVMNHAIFYFTKPTVLMVTFVHYHLGMLEMSFDRRAVVNSLVSSSTTTTMLVIGKVSRNHFS